MANTFNFGNGNWAQKTEKVLAYNAENNNYKPLPFDFDRASTATRVNKQGLIETVGVDEPRIDFLNNSKGHLLLEPERRNLIEYSNLESGWSLLSGGSIAYDQTISPDGTQNAAILSGDGVNGNSIYDSVSLSVQSYTFSVFAKQKNVSVISLKGFSSGAAGTSKFNLSNGTIDTASGGQFSDEKIENYGNGWYRCSVKVTATSSGSKLLGFGGENSDSGELFSLYGAQVEDGSYATSYIPTQGSAVTRSAESCYQQNDYVLSNTSGTIFFELGNYNTNTSASGFNKILTFQEVSSSSLDNLIYFEEYNGENTILVRKGGSTLLQSTPGYQDLRGSKIAIKFSNTEAKIFIDGVLNNTYSGDASLSLEYFGFDNPYNGQIVSTIKLKDLKLYNTALTDAELIQLTS